MPQAESRGRCVLPAMPLERATDLLAGPRLPDDAVRQVAHVGDAAAMRIPVTLVVPSAGPRLPLARALHAVAGRAGRVIAVTGARPRLRTVPVDATLVVDVDVLAPSARLVLDALIDDGVIWVIAMTAVEPPPHLASLVVRVPALAERRDVVPALATAILATLAARRGVPPSGLTDAAAVALVAHDWPGDQPELEATLARALLCSHGGDVDAVHLRLPETTPGAQVPPPAEHREHLEFLLAEMAHELKNPLVTIKTFADHLPALLDDAELRERFATLSDDAITRMDGLLDNVLDFARLDSPRPQAVAIGAVLDRLLAEVAPELAARSVTIRRSGDDARCAADPEHVAFALRNVLAGVVREVPPREDLMLDASANGVVRVGFAAGGAAATRLRQLASPGGPHDLADPTLLPLAFTLARAVIERNGGTLDVAPDADGRTTLVVRLPTADPENAHGG
ncbi:MAG TPA: histidine kinase dimerization/phospho-acceptor domain-containing protein [Candidatus Binatia bacterium]|nr:histidine kinase dimerization/phospho-acceptor domain-containing protein [Candidatus Binatia bacterium]